MSCRASLSCLIFLAKCSIFCSTGSISNVTFDCATELADVRASPTTAQLGTSINMHGCASTACTQNNTDVGAGGTATPVFSLRVVCQDSVSGAVAAVVIANRSAAENVASAQRFFVTLPSSTARTLGEHRVTCTVEAMQVQAIAYQSLISAGGGTSPGSTIYRASCASSPATSRPQGPAFDRMLRLEASCSAVRLKVSLPLLRRRSSAQAVRPTRPSPPPRATPSWASAPL